LSVTLLSYNIRFGGIGREENLAKVIKDSEADLVILQEATRPQVVERVARASGMTSWGARAGHSLGFLSRIEIASHDWRSLPGSRRAFLEVVTRDGEFRIFGVHLSAIHSNWTERRRVRELRALLHTIGEDRDGFHILIGDFNTLAPGELLETRRLPLRLRPFIWLSGGFIRWETIQIMLDSGYVDAYRIFHPLENGFTFPTWNPHVRLDYVFVPSTHAKNVKSCELLSKTDAVSHASDHLPLRVDLEF